MRQVRRQSWVEGRHTVIPCIIVMVQAPRPNCGCPVALCGFQSLKMLYSADDQFRDVVRRVLNDPEKRLDLRLVASRVGVSYRVLMHWIGTDPERRLPAELLPRLCAVIGNHDPLDFLEHQAGRLAFSIAPLEGEPEQDLREAHKLMREATEAIESLLRTLEDGVVEDREAEKTTAELDDVIRQCLRVRHRLGRQRTRRVPV